MATLILQLLIMGLDYLLKDSAEKKALKAKIIAESAKYHKNVLNSQQIRREYDALKDSFNKEPK